MNKDLSFTCKVDLSGFLDYSPTLIDYTFAASSF